mmetsp:Transcript_11226/g.25213  ORF Transcript_11226/g.25213 Transcript_11226/m.25213 type:complete len:489 (+) Transcript_11226:73-1539(+)
MFEFDELEEALPAEAYVVTGCGTSSCDGLYQDTGLALLGAPIFRHSALGDHLLARERCGERHGWVLGASGRPLYGIRTDALECPESGWRPFGGDAPAPRVQGFSSTADASIRFCDVLCEQAEACSCAGHLRRAVDAYRQAMALPLLPPGQGVKLHAFCARAFRQLAEKRKAAQPARPTEQPEKEGERVHDAGAAPRADEEENNLESLAAEWAIEEAEEALRLDPRCYLAAWEGAIAAKHIGWWSRSRSLAKKAVEAVPAGAENRAQRETANMLFLLVAEEEQAEKARKVQEMNSLRHDPAKDLDPAELEWATNVAQRLNEVLRQEDFRRPHHQLWKQISPALREKEAEGIFDQIRDLVWQKWHPVAEQHGYHTAQDKSARSELCARIVEVVNTGHAKELAKILREIEDKLNVTGEAEGNSSERQAEVQAEIPQGYSCRLKDKLKDRVCLEWQDIPSLTDKPVYDETWAWTRREDKTWGAWNLGRPELH